MKPSTPIKMIHDIPVIFEDKFLLVVDKPAGIPSQSDQDGTLGVIELIRKVLPQAALVHRLDRPVGGLLVIARNSKSAAKLSAAIREDQFGKDYLAVLWGKPEHASATLNDRLVRDGHSNTSSVADPSQSDNAQAKNAILHYETLASTTLPAEAIYGSKWSNISPFADLFGSSSTPENTTTPPTEAGSNSASSSDASVNSSDLTLVRIRLQTGRHHQIRVQMAHMGCPIFGDRKYGAEHLGKLEPKYRPDMPALYSYKLSFKHPDSGDLKTFYSLPANHFPFDLFQLDEVIAETPEV